MNSETAIKFWLHMLDECKALHRHKLKDKKMKRFASMLHVFRVMKRKEFNRFSMTLGNKIYTPWDIGAPEPSPEAQVITCVHECHHRLTGVNYLKYIFSKTYRVDLEIDAYETNMEMYHYVYSELKDPDEQAEILKSYRASPQQIKRAESRFAAINRRILNGKKSENHVVRIAQKYLEGK